MSNKLRITGLATGLDVDTIVKSMLKADNSKIDSLKQKRQLLVWKQEMYRSYLTEMTSFRNTYFNSLKADTNMLSQNSYSGFDVANTLSSTSSIATATASSGATAGTYTVKDITTALTASYSSNTSISTREANYAIKFPVKAADITTSNYDKLTLDVNGTAYSINLSGDHSSLSSLVSDINAKLVSADKSGTATDISKNVTAVLSSDGTSIEFKATTGNTLNSVLDSTNTSLVGNKMNFNINIEAGVNDRLLFNVNGVTSSITLGAGAYGSLAQLSSEVNNRLTAAGLNTTLETGVSLDGTRIKFINKDSNAQISIQGTGAGLLGFPTSGFDVQPSVSSRMSSLFSSEADARVSFTINGKSFNYDFSSTGADRNKTIYNVLSDISSTAGVKMSYSEIGRKFTVESLSTGLLQSITASEAADGSGGAFLQTLFGTRSISEVGRDATATIINPKGESLTVNRSTNTIGIDGITINLLKDDNSIDGVKFTVSANVQKTYDKIVSFVEKYNELIGKIQTDITEKKQYNYMPLTDEQKKGMSETDIKNWEEKAKEGLLKSDSSFQNMVYSLRRAFFDEVEGAGISLNEIGLSTSADYSQGGKIIINEEKLKSAILNNGTQVMNLFAKDSAIDYDPDHKTDAGRYSEIGIFQRVNDIFNDYSRSRTGILVQKAGIKGEVSEITSIMSKQISQEFDYKITRLTKQLAAKENKYYLQYSKLETAMQKLNSQSSWLASQLGSMG